MYLCIFHLTHEDFMFRIFEPQCWDILFLCVASGVFLYSALCVMFQTMTMLWNAWDAICLTPRRKDRRLFLQMGNCKCKWSSQLIWKTLISSREIQFWRVAITRLSKHCATLQYTRMEICMMFFGESCFMFYTIYPRPEKKVQHCDLIKCSSEVWVRTLY